MQLISPTSTVTSFSIYTLYFVYTVILSIFCRRFCGVGKWYCQCQWDSDSDGEEGGSDESWMADGTEWETDTEDEEQDEGLSTPAEKNSLKPKNISPEDATATKQTTGKRMLFVEGK